METTGRRRKSVSTLGTPNFQDNSGQYSRQKSGLLSKIFPARKLKKKRSVSQLVKTMQVRKYSPKVVDKDFVIIAEGDGVHQIANTEQNSLTNNNHTFFSQNLQGDEARLRPEGDFKPSFEHDNVNRSISPKRLSDKDKLIESIRRNKTYFEMVKVVDHGTSPCEIEKFLDKSTDPLIPGDSLCFHWEREKDKLLKDVSKNEHMVDSCLEEGKLLFDNVKALREQLSGTVTGEKIQMYMSEKNDTPKSLVHMSRQCFNELGKCMLSERKRYESETRKLKVEIDAQKKGKFEKEHQITTLQKQIEELKANLSCDSDKLKQWQEENEKLQDTVGQNKKHLKDIEKSYKLKIEKLEADISTQKQSNSKLSQDLKAKTDLVASLEDKVKSLYKNLTASKEELKDMQCAFKSKLAKLELEHTNKVAAVCENQTLANKQLTQALNQSSHYTNQIQDLKKDNLALSSQNKSLNERVVNMERDLGKAHERSLIAERRLQRESQEVTELKQQLHKIETAKEEEILSIDGDVWCKIMYQQDQAMLDDLRASLKEKEASLDVLRAQGDCSLKEYEKVQCELQQRRLQFNELKDVFLDFEIQRDNLVRDQREFYRKMSMLNKTTIPREKFFKSLIDEVHLKSAVIEDLESKLNAANKGIEENNKASEAQLKSLQTENRFAKDKLYEFENQLRIKDSQIQDLIKVFEQERQDKFTVEESLNSYKSLLEEVKKDNYELKSKVHYLEDAEKNRMNVIREVEELTKDSQSKQDTENKLKSLEKELSELKSKMDSKEDLTPKQHNKSKAGKEVEHLRKKIQDLTDTKKYVERILLESQRSKDSLQKDHEDLCNKMRHAVKVMVESKKNQEALELKLEQRRHTIQELQKSHADTEDRLDDLKDLLHEMKQTISLLQRDREDLKDKLLNHTHCHAERTLYEETKLLQREKTIIEEQNNREKEMLLRRIKDNEEAMRDQHKHLRAFQDQLDGLNLQLREAKTQLATERHNHTQQLLSLQADKKKQELYIQELERRLTIETRLRMSLTASDSLPSSPKFFSSDSYEPPSRDFPKPHFYKK